MAVDIRTQTMKAPHIQITSANKCYMYICFIVLRRVVLWLQLKYNSQLNHQHGSWMNRVIMQDKYFHLWYEHNESPIALVKNKNTDFWTGHASRFLIYINLRYFKRIVLNRVLKKCLKWKKHAKSKLSRTIFNVHTDFNTFWAQLEQLYSVTLWEFPKNPWTMVG